MERLSSSSIIISSALARAKAISVSSHPDLFAPVALVVDVPEENLTRGQIGTVVEHLEADGDLAELVEFSDTDGQAYAIVTLKPEHLLVLHRRNRAA